MSACPTGTAPHLFCEVCLHHLPHQEVRGESSRRHAACNSGQCAHARGAQHGQRCCGAVLARDTVYLNQGSRQLLGFTQIL